VLNRTADEYRRYRWAREKARVHSSDRSGQWDEDWDTKAHDDLIRLYCIDHPGVSEADAQWRLARRGLVMPSYRHPRGELNDGKAPKNQDNATDTEADTKAQQQLPSTHPPPMRQAYGNSSPALPEATPRLSRGAKWR
jgi:hypothetical protein